MRKNPASISRRKTTDEKGSVYLVVTMAATLLVLALGTPRLIRAISGNWNQASEPASQQEQNVQISSGTEQQQHKVDNFIGKKPRRCLPPTSLSHGTTLKRWNSTARNLQRVWLPISRSSREPPSGARPPSPYMSAKALQANRYRSWWERHRRRQSQSLER